MRARSGPVLALSALMAILVVGSSTAGALDLATDPPPIVALPAFVAAMSGHSVTVSNDSHGRCLDGDTPVVTVPAVGFTVEADVDEDDGLWVATLPAATWAPGIYTVEAACRDNVSAPDSFPYAPTTVEVTAAGPDDDPAPPTGYRWAAFHAFLDASPALFSSSGCPRDAVFFYVSGTCEGEYRTPTTTWPFNEDRHGTLRWWSTGSEQRMTLDVVGAHLGGVLGLDANNRSYLRVTEGKAPWGSTIHSPDVPGAARGTKGGPLEVDATRVPTHDGYYFDIWGWFLVPAAPAASSGGSGPAPSASVAAKPAIAAPRFTG